MAEKASRATRKKKRISDRGMLILVAFLVASILGYLGLAFVITVGRSSQVDQQFHNGVRAAKGMAVCVKAFSDKNPEHGFPRSLASLVNQESECIDREIRNWKFGSDGMETSQWKITYIPEPNETGLISSFQVHVRPPRTQIYPRDLSRGIFRSITQKSLVTDETGIIRYTDDDRNATRNDPKVHK